MKVESIGTCISDLQAQLDRHRELTERKPEAGKGEDKQKKRKGVKPNERLEKVLEDA